MTAEERQKLDDLRKENADIKLKIKAMENQEQDREKKEFEDQKKSIKDFCDQAVKDKKMLSANRDLIFSGLDKENPDLEMLKGIAENQVKYKEGERC